MSGTGVLSAPRWPRKPFALTTGDPAFDPDAPLTVNGFAFEPARPSNQLVDDDDMGGEIDG